ncbi:MAG TPA: hypothetical protein VEL74_00050 [Thermoanaerobaculia bacterium]|nr:hypothetical protein [Thermoanaerobaculia bacterium]
MRSMRRPLVVLALCLVLAFVPVASHAAAHAAPLALPNVPAFGLGAVLGDAWSAVQSFMSKILVSGGGDDDGTTSTTQGTPPTGSGTPPAGGTGDNGPGIDPNG